MFLYKGQTDDEWICSELKMVKKKETVTVGERNQTSLNSPQTVRLHASVTTSSDVSRMSQNVSF